MSAVEYLKRVLGDEATLQFQYFGDMDRSPTLPPYLGIAEAEDSNGFQKTVFDAYQGDSPEAVARVALANIHDWIDRVPDYSDSFRTPMPPPVSAESELILAGIPYDELVEIIGKDVAPKLSKSAQRRRGVNALDRLWEAGLLRAHINQKENRT